MVTKLQSLLRPVRRGLEPQDVVAAFLVAARARWGDRMPLDPARYARGVLTVRCPSALWRTELAFAARALAAELQRSLDSEHPRRLAAVLM